MDTNRARELVTEVLKEQRQEEIISITPSNNEPHNGTDDKLLIFFE